MSVFRKVSENSAEVHCGQPTPVDGVPGTEVDPGRDRARVDGRCEDSHLQLPHHVRLHYPLSGQGRRHRLEVTGRCQGQVILV